MPKVSELAVYLPVSGIELTGSGFHLHKTFSHFSKCIGNQKNKLAVLIVIFLP